MRDQEIIGIYESYHKIYENQETLEEKKIATETGKKVMPSAEERSKLAKRARAGEDIGKKGKGFEAVATKAAKQYGSKEAGERVAAAAMFKQQAHKEEFDTFDVVLEYLISEGFAETNENALAIMVNMSEEWRQSIISESRVRELGDRLKNLQKRGEATDKRAAKTSKVAKERFKKLDTAHDAVQSAIKTHMKGQD
jgi:F0F1-type ATP synthase epsilon subunit